MSLTPLPLQPRKVHLWRKVFALLAVNGPLPAELNFRENIGLLSFFFSIVSICLLINQCSQQSLL